MTSGCTTDCAGNRRQNCGGVQKNQIYLIGGNIATKVTHLLPLFVTKTIINSECWVSLKHPQHVSGSFAIWSNNQPNNAGGYQTCVAIHSSNLYKFGDERCEQSFYYICEIGENTLIPILITSQYKIIYRISSQCLYCLLFFL